MAYALSGEEETLRWLLALGAPHLWEQVTEGPGDDRWVIHVAAVDWKVSRGDDSPPHELSVDPDRCAVTLRGPREWLPVLALRYMRAIDRVVAVQSGYLPFHGACFGGASECIGVVGPHRSGKTTAALSIVRTFDGVLLANDDVLLGGGVARWQARGLPRSVGVRVDGLDELVPPISRDGLVAATSLHPMVTEAKIFLAPSELTTFGIRSSRDAFRLAAIVEMAIWQGPPRLALSVGPRSVLDEWVDDTADRFRPEFAALVGPADVPNRSDALGCLAAEIPVYRFDHPPRGWIHDLLDAVVGLISWS